MFRLRVKKDWNYIVNLSGVVYSLIIMSFCLVILMGTIFLPEHKVFFRERFEEFQVGFGFMLFMYPILTFTAIAPEFKTNKLYLNTANLPYTKKQLFIKSLKPGFIGILIIIIGTSLLNVFLVQDNLKFSLLYILSLAKPLLVLFLSTIVGFQVIAGIIIFLVKKIKGYKVVAGIALANLFLGLICAVTSYFLGKEITDTYYWVFVILGIYFIFSLILFLVTFRDIEKISR